MSAATLPTGQEPHAVCVPFPTQGHITPMLKLAKILHARGFRVTFVNTEYNHRRLVRSRGAAAVAGLTAFRFATIPDGLPESDADATQDPATISYATKHNCPPHLRSLLAGLDGVTCVVADNLMSFSLDAAREMGVPCALFWTASACGYMGYRNFRLLIDRGIIPFKDEEQLTNGFMDTPVNWAPGMSKHMRLKDFPTFLRTTDPNDVLMNFQLQEVERSEYASAVVINTFDELEQLALDAMRAIIPAVYTIGPLASVTEQVIVRRGPLDAVSCSLWREDQTRLAWLDARKPRPRSVVYVNFGSITVMSGKHMRLKDFPTFLRTTDPNDVLMNFQLQEVERSEYASAVVINTFDELEQLALDAMRAIIPAVYTIGPLASVTEQVIVRRGPLDAVSCSLWREDQTRLAWLDARKPRPRSVVYVNFGSITVMSGKHMRLKDFPTFLRTTDPNDVLMNFQLQEVERSEYASAVVINTFDELEQLALDAMRAIIPAVYTIGPLASVTEQVIVRRGPLDAVSCSLWREDQTCLAWLDARKPRPRSVVYVNFGSITVMSGQELAEFASGLASSGHDFLWIVRPDVVKGDTSSAAALPPGFLEATKGRGLLASWCDQEAVLRHEAVGLFLTHSGWNSTLESLGAGVPMLCWPFFAEQQTNCRYKCVEWGVAMEVGDDVRREAVEARIREAMGGDKGKEMARRAAEWKEAAAGSAARSLANLNRLINDVLLSPARLAAHSKWLQ